SISTSARAACVRRSISYLSASITATSLPGPLTVPFQYSMSSAPTLHPLSSATRVHTSMARERFSRLAATALVACIAFQTSHRANGGVRRALPPEDLRARHEDRTSFVHRTARTCMGSAGFARVARLHSTTTAAEAPFVDPGGVRP